MTPTVCWACRRANRRGRHVAHTCDGDIILPGIGIVCRCQCNQPPANFDPGPSGADHQMDDTADTLRTALASIVLVASMGATVRDPADHTKIHPGDLS